MFSVAVWLSGNVLGRINKVTIHCVSKSDAIYLSIIRILIARL